MRSLKEEKTTSFPSKLPAIEKLKTTMMERTGIVRTKDSLEKQQSILKSLRSMNG